MAEAASTLFNWKATRDTVKGLRKRSDIYFAVAVMAILTTLVMPLPAMLLDLMLGVSLTLSVMILMTVLFAERPLHLSSFPTILLIVTMLRLSLNIASVRLILSHGHEGTAAAGHVIQAFGGFVMGGSIIIGAIIFGILTIINFVVITKGSGRIAEVSARFSLDAMPGKQMAIDADLSAGLINEDVAKQRRKELEDESNFFGSMDGASKFVRGDAIAGILITFINFVAGILIGVVQNGISFHQALNTYTILTVGDGLVSQIPALIVSTAAGILVTKSAISGSAEKAVIGQLTRNPTALAITSGFLFLMALMPGIPAAPFLLLAGLVGYISWYMFENPGAMQEKTADTKKLGGPADQKGEGKPTEESPGEYMQIDSIRMELGYGLLPLINYNRGHRLTDQIKALRKQMGRELGFVIPSVRIQDNMQLPPNIYIIKIKEIEAARGEIKADMLLTMNPTGGPILLQGEPTTEPTFGLPAMWISEIYREEAMFKNYTVVDPPTIVTTHLTEIIKENMAELLSYTETQKLIDDLAKTQQKLVSETIPAHITLSGVQRVLQNLLRELVSIRDLSTILEAISEISRGTQNQTMITEHVRMRLARQISSAHTSEAGYIPIIAMSPQWEQIFNEALGGSTGEERMLSMAPSRIQEFIQAVRGTFDSVAATGENPVLLTSPIIRPYVRTLVERFRPSTVVLSQNEIFTKARIKTVGQI